jgi:hypothetical protein
MARTMQVVNIERIEVIATLPPLGVVNCHLPLRDWG